MNADDPDVPDIPDAAPQRLVWTTAGIPDSQRLEYWTEAVSSALFEMGMSTPVKENFQSFVETAPLDALVVTSLGGTRREAIRAKQYIGLSNNYSFHILVDFTKPWILRWRGTPIDVAAGQIALTDTRHVHSGTYPEDSATGRINIKLPPQWVGKWLRQPDRMVGRPIPRGSGWGMALSAFVAQMSPKLAMAPPLPARLIADQLGGLLSLVESELFPASAPTGESQLADRIVDVVRQRSSEMSLLAKDVADALGVSERTLHRHLQSAGKTFSSTLQDSRIEAARQMLESPHLRLLTTAEIGVRCGFGDPSHFTRVMRARLGQSPGSYRRSFIGGAAPTGAG